MELHHPIMSKLWDIVGRTKRKRKGKSAEIFIQAIVPATYIDDLSQNFVNLWGRTPYKLTKHLKNRYSVIDDMQNMELKGKFNKFYDPSEPIINL